MAKVRHATEADLPTLIALGRLMHAEAPALNHAPYDPNKVSAGLAFAMKSGIVLVHESGEGQIDAAIAGLILPRWFSQQEHFTDLGLFVLPNLRGSIIAVRLVDAVIDLCRERGMDARDVTFSVSTGVHPEKTGRMFEGMNFGLCGGVYQLRSY